MSGKTVAPCIQRLLRGLIPLAALAALGAWVYLAPPGAMGKLDAIGYAVCHRIEARSFHVNGRQMPLCARCTGEFNAAAAALIVQGFVSRRRSRLPSRGILTLLALFFLLFAVDGSNSYLYLLKQNRAGVLANLPILYVPNNTLRLFTGSGMGLALACVLYPMYNQSLWRTPDERPSLNWPQFGLLAAGVLGMNFGILTENPLVLYAVALLSALGVLALLSMVFSMVWVIGMKQDNSFERPGQLWLSSAAGLTLALLLLLGIDLLRFQLTQTWSGFPGLSG